MANKQLYILCDLEGASGISPANRQAMHYGSELWHAEGRALITSDVKAVCEAAVEFGIDEIVINDDHDLGHREPNLLVHELPGNVKMVPRPHLPGTPRKRVQADPFGMIIVGQHAMYGGGGFAPHTVQSPPIGEVTLNGIRVGEIGLALALFMGVKLLAIAGEEAATREAQALCPSVVTIPVKSLERDWFPPATETYGTIKERTAQALAQQARAHALVLAPPFRFTMKPSDGFAFVPGGSGRMGWLMSAWFARWLKGRVSEEEASWEAGTVVRGHYGLQFARSFLRRRQAEF